MYMIINNKVRNSLSTLSLCKAKKFHTKSKECKSIMLNILLSILFILISIFTYSQDISKPYI